MKLAAIVLLGIILVSGPVMAGIDIVFDYSYDDNNFFNTSTSEGLAARARMTDVENYYESILADDLAAIVPGGSSRWTPRFYDPATGAQCSGTVNMVVPADTIIVYVGGQDMSSLGQAGYGWYSATGGDDWLDLLATRGEAEGTDFGPWGGSISFDTQLNTSYTWNFSADAPGFYQYDFMSVALHEMAHVLGFGSAKSWDNLVDTDNDTFLGTKSVTEYGSPVPLDGNNAHWNYGTMSDVNGAPQETAMDPNIANGRRKYFTDLDLTGLDDIGWEIVEPLLLGDANRDGVVSADDYASVQANFGNVGQAGLAGDANGDGVVSADDYVSIRTNFGNTSSGSGVIPEPASILIIGCGTVALIRRRR